MLAVVNGPLAEPEILRRITGLGGTLKSRYLTGDLQRVCLRETAKVETTQQFADESATMLSMQVASFVEVMIPRRPDRAVTGSDRSGDVLRQQR